MNGKAQLPSFLGLFLSSLSSRILHQHAPTCTLLVHCTNKIRTRKVGAVGAKPDGKQTKVMSFAPTCTNVGGASLLVLWSRFNSKSPRHPLSELLGRKYRKGFASELPQTETRTIMFWDIYTIGCRKIDAHAVSYKETAFVPGTVGFTTTAKSIFVYSEYSVIPRVQGHFYKPYVVRSSQGSRDQ